MTHYLDVHLRPDPEFPAHQLLSALYMKLHRALAQAQATDIGVSFPAHDHTTPTLGSHLRLHASAASLGALLTTAWLTGMRDHVLVSEVLLTPADAQHRRVQRMQAKSSPDRLRRRAMRRHGIDAAAAQQRIPDTAAERLRLPFVQLGSRSTGQAAFPLFIQHGPVQPHPIPGAFNSYGLSQGATIPWF